MNDDLAQLLKTWESDIPADPGFRASVWRRIDARSAENSWFGSLLAVFQTPAVAAALVMVTILTGALAGAALRPNDADRYIHSVNPYARSL